MLNSFFSSKQVCERFGLLVGLVLGLSLVTSAWGAPPPPQMAPQETNAIKAMSAIRQAQADYRLVNLAYPATFGDLTGSTPVYLIDFSTPMGGYTYTLMGGGAAEAVPDDTSLAYLYADQDGLYTNYGGPATSASTPWTIDLGMGSYYSDAGAIIGANQTAAMDDICEIATAQVSYYASNLGQFATTLDQLGMGSFPVAPAVRNGYKFTFTSGGVSGYELEAEPDVMGTSGLRGFFLDSTDGVVHAAEGAVADGSSPVYAAQCDSDLDGLTNLQEKDLLPAATDYRSADSDGDGVNDGTEAIFGTDPNDPNSPAAPGVPAASWMSVLAVMASLAAGGFVLRRKHGAAIS